MLFSTISRSLTLGLFLSLLAAVPAQAQLTFLPMMPQGLGNAEYGEAAWGDLDGDGDLDVILTGNAQTLQRDPVPVGAAFLHEGDTTLVLGNGTILNVSQYTEVFNGDLVDVYRSAAELADFDGDGDLDPLYMGRTLSGAARIYVYRNLGTGRRYALVAALEGLRDGDLAWGDYDNDGDLDFVASGIDDAGTYRALLYERRGVQAAEFVPRDVGLRGLAFGALEWGDYDNDGDLDLLTVGLADPQAFLSLIYRNDGGGQFTEINAGLEGLLFPSAAWGDFDNDGDLDVLLNGGRLSPFILEGRAKVYRNDGGVFTDIGVVLAGGYYGSADWGDFDGDGRRDALVMGGTFPIGAATLRAHRNLGGGAFESVSGLGGRVYGRAAWGDYDNDGDLDVLSAAHRPICNLDPNGCAHTDPYRNELVVDDAPPSPPTNLRAEIEGTTVTFRWDPASDDRTPAPGLTYNLRVGTAPRTADIVSAMAVPLTGVRLVSEPGNVGHNLSWSIQGLPEGTYFWSVQALDAAHHASAFADEARVSTGGPTDSVPPAPPTGLVALGDEEQVTLRWNASPEPDVVFYQLYRGTEPAPTARLAAVLAGTETYLDTEVTNGIRYYYRVTAIDASGNESGFSEETFVTPNVPITSINMRTRGIVAGDLAWGNFNGDDVLDLVLTSEGPRTRVLFGRTGDFSQPIFENQGTGGRFSGAGGAVATLDYDNDGDDDIAVAGHEEDSGRQTILYRNDGGTISLAVAQFVGVSNGALEAADYDGDGDLDLLVAGLTDDETGVTILYRNDGGEFVDSGLVFPGLRIGSARWGDYDADGDPDFALAGTLQSGESSALIYRNDGGTFTLAATLPGDVESAVDWGDLEADGDLDLVVTTQIQNLGTRIYRNDGGAFVDAGIDLPRVINASVGWGDLNGDGAEGLLMSGFSGQVSLTLLLRNLGGQFEQLALDVPALSGSSIEWADFEGDGDEDIIISGGDSRGSGPLYLIINNRLTP